MDSHDIFLITGANTGLGFQIVRSLCNSEKAYIILLGGRSLVKVKQAIISVTEEFPSTHSKLFPVELDIEDDASIQRAFDVVKTKFSRLDALINNAGLFLPRPQLWRSLTTLGAQLDQQLVAGKMSMREMWNASWNINTTGTHIMTATFIPLLIQSRNPRLLFMASGTSTLSGTENLNLAVNHYPPKGWPKSAFDVAAYRSAKAGMNMMMREWYRMLHEDGVKVWCISPGFLATGLGGDPEALKKMGAQDPVLAGAFIKSVLEGERDGDVGKVILKDGVQQW